MCPVCGEDIRIPVTFVGYLGDKPAYVASHDDMEKAIAKHLAQHTQDLDQELRDVIAGS